MTRGACRYAKDTADTKIDVEFGGLTIVGNRDSVACILSFLNGPTPSSPAKPAPQQATAPVSSPVSQDAAEPSATVFSDVAPLPRDVVASDPGCSRTSLQLSLRVRCLALVLNTECDGSHSGADNSGFVVPRSRTVTSMVPPPSALCVVVH